MVFLTPLQLHRSVEMVKLTTKKVNELEKDLTEMEGTNDRVERENKYLNKEASLFLGLNRNTVAEY